MPSRPGPPRETVLRLIRRRWRPLLICRRRWRPLLICRRWWRPLLICRRRWRPLLICRRWWRPLLICRRRRRRIVSPCAGDHVPLRVHALLIGNVVAPLERIPGICALVAPDSGPGEEAGRTADCCTGTRVTPHRAEGRTEPCACKSPDCCSRNGVLIGGPTGRRSADLLLRPLPARRIIGLEYLERLSRAGHHRDARARGYGGASSEQRGEGEEEKSPFHAHCAAPPFPA